VQIGVVLKHYVDWTIGAQFNHVFPGHLQFARVLGLKHQSAVFLGYDLAGDLVTVGKDDLVCVQRLAEQQHTRPQ
jgi:hypothetical protein